MCPGFCREGLRMVANVHQFIYKLRIMIWVLMSIFSAEFFSWGASVIAQIIYGTKKYTYMRIFDWNLICAKFMALMGQSILVEFSEWKLRFLNSTWKLQSVADSFISWSRTAILLKKFTEYRPNLLSRLPDQPTGQSLLFHCFSYCVFDVRFVHRASAHKLQFMICHKISLNPNTAHSVFTMNKYYHSTQFSICLCGNFI